MLNRTIEQKHSSLPLMCTWTDAPEWNFKKKLYLSGALESRRVMRGAASTNNFLSLGLTHLQTMIFVLTPSVRMLHCSRFSFSFPWFDPSANYDFRSDTQRSNARILLFPSPGSLMPNTGDAIVNISIKALTMQTLS